MSAEGEIGEQGVGEQDKHLVDNILFNFIIIIIVIIKEWSGTYLTWSRLLFFKLPHLTKSPLPPTQPHHLSLVEVSQSQNGHLRTGTWLTSTPPSMTLKSQAVQARQLFKEPAQLPGSWVVSPLGALPAGETCLSAPVGQCRKCTKHTAGAGQCRPPARLRPPLPARLRSILGCTHTSTLPHFHTSTLTLTLPPPAIFFCASSLVRGTGGDPWLIESYYVVKSKLEWVLTRMVCPGVVRKVGKLVPTILQALALVVCIHVVGQVMCLRYLWKHGHWYQCQWGLFLISLLRVCWPGTDRLSTGSAGTIRPQDWALAPTKSPKWVFVFCASFCKILF